MPESLLQPEGRVLPTLEADGRRRWITPRIAVGRFFRRRQVVAYFLIGLFTAIPFIQINGKPAMLLDIANRRFTLFGYTFLPTDTVLLALLMVSIILSIFFFTALLGRVWCGWACPQTVYMEYVFRPIERLCTGRRGIGGKPAKNVAAWRVGLQYLLFLLVSLYLAHTFLSYFVGVDELRRWMTRSPLEHPWSFGVMLFVTAAMLFDFVYFREQTCLIACPYGRFQSVLLDRNSLIVEYDRKRGEPRGKARRPVAIALPTADTRPTTGDCIDCTLCEQVCPTGIDIRDGLQFECIACTQCIDACDAVMDKIGRPRGLIRYTSQAATAGAPRRIIRPRVVIYGLLITGLISLLTYLIATKSPFDVHLARNPGLPFTIVPSGQVENVMRLNLTNRTDAARTVSLSVVDADDVVIAEGGERVVLPTGKMLAKPIHLLAPRQSFHEGKRSVILRVTDETGRFVEKKCLLFGPGSGAHHKESDEHQEKK